jgi:hypothetical protein
MAQDFWGSSGYRELEATPGGLRPTAAWFARFLAGEELRPPAEAGPRERALHARLAADPLAPVDASELGRIEDADAADNWREFLKFRERLLALGTLEATYRDLYRRPAVDLAPPFVDSMVHAIVRAMLEGVADPWQLRAGEMFFRKQRVSTEEGRVLAADAATIEVYAETGGFGSVGRLLRAQSTPTAEVKMDILNGENAPFYFLRDELFSFVLDLTPGGEGALALAKVLERWVLRVAGARASIEPVARIEDERWRWHVGLDVDGTAILNSLYRAEEVPPSDLERLVTLFRLDFAAGAPVLAEALDRPVYLALACRPDRTLRMKPQNLLVGLPLAGDRAAEA